MGDSAKRIVLFDIDRRYPKNKVDRNGKEKQNWSYPCEDRIDLYDDWPCYRADYGLVRKPCVDNCSLPYKSSWLDNDGNNWTYLYCKAQVCRQQTI